MPNEIEKTAPDMQVPCIDMYKIKLIINIQLLHSIVKPKEGQ